MKTTLTIFALLVISTAAMSQTKANGSAQAPVKSAIAGGTIPGGPIISSQMKPGSPIGGIVVRGGKPTK